MERKNLKARLDKGLARVHTELENLPGEYAIENWARQRDLMERIRGLTKMKACFTTRVEPHPEDRFWREILY